MKKPCMEVMTCNVAQARNPSAMVKSRREGVTTSGVLQGPRSRAVCNPESGLVT